MSSSAVLSGAQSAAYRVWSIPHIRQALIEHMTSAAVVSAPEFDPHDFFWMKQRRALTRYLTLERASFREVAFQLYPDIRLDQFPWDCPCEERMRVYAAGVRLLSTQGCMPLCCRWPSLADMLQFFPNVEAISFKTVGACYVRARRREFDTDELHLDQKVTVEGGSVCPPRKRYLPDNLSYQCLYGLEGGTGLPTQRLPPFGTPANPSLPDVLLLPAYEVLVWSSFGDEIDWTSALQERTQKGITTRRIMWTAESFEEVESLVDVVGPGLTALDIVCSSPDFDGISYTANAIMDCICEGTFPDLKHLTLRLFFPCRFAPEPPQTNPKWHAPDASVPPKLDSITLELVIDDWGLDLDEVESKGSLYSYVESVFTDEAPDNFIMDVRYALGEDFNLVVDTQYLDDEHGVRVFHRAKPSYIDFLLEEPLPAIDGESDSETTGDLSSGSAGQSIASDGLGIESEGLSIEGDKSCIAE